MSENKKTKIMNKTEAILYVFDKHSVDITCNLEVLHTDLLFLENAINLVIGESKSGKTYTTIKSLVDAGLKDRIIHLDFDRNADLSLRQLNIATYHIADANKFLNDLGDLGDVTDSLTGKILVIDSLQDLATIDGYDTNKAALQTMQRVMGFRDTGATVIVIHHVTLETVGNIKMPKVKGNATTITSKCDTTLTFTRDSKTKRTMTVMNTRAEDKIPTGKSVEFKSGSSSKGSSSEVPA